MKKKTGSISICSLLAATMLTGCGADANLELTQQMVPEPADVVPEETNSQSQDPDNGTVNTVAVSDFDKALVEFVDAAGFSDQNYMVSPTSFKAALALAVAGADTETKEQLIHSMGFNSQEEVNVWYSSVMDIIAIFDQYIELDKENFEQEKKYLPDDAKAPEGSLVMLNSIWNNTDLNGKFSKEYLKYVENTYDAKASDVNSKEITDKVNKWVNDGTNGLIPTISNDLSNANAVLINTLYLKSSWVNSFESFATSKDTFTTAKGAEVQKDFMNQQENYRFYETDGGKLVVLPLNGGIDAVFVLGDVGDIHDAIEKSNYEEVVVKLPKFEVESSFSNNEFIDFLIGRGAELPFSMDADFSVMCKDTSWMISDIIQKTKIKVDEDGLEAAAATAIIMAECALIVEDPPKEFIADKPFRFYICGGDADSEILFCGQVAE